MGRGTGAKLSLREGLIRLGPYISILVLLCLWQLAVHVFEIPRYLLPGIPDIASAFLQQSEILWQGVQTTLLEVAVSFIISVFVGLLLAVLVLRSRLFSRAVLPLVVLGQSVPILAAAPLFIVWFGFGLPPKVVIATLITFFPILMGVVLGIRSIDENILTMSRSIGLSSWQRFSKIELPGALPHLFGALRIAVTLVLVGVIVGEFVGSQSGLGYIILRATGVMDTSLLFASLITLIFIGLCLFGVLSLVERVVMPWHDQSFRT